MSDCAIITSDIMDAYLESMDTFNDYSDSEGGITMPKINPDAIRTMIQWLGLKNDGRMESDRGLIEETYDCPFVKTYNSPDGKLTANYSCGYLVSIAYNDTYIAVHTDLDGSDIIRCTFEDEDFNEYEYTI